MNIIKNYQKNDLIGASASFLCMIHCVATPFIFIASACSKSCCSSSSVPAWWIFIDFFFLLISFTAIYRTVKMTSLHWIKFALWGSWASLFLSIIIEQYDIYHNIDYLKYFSAFLIIFFHFYNIKYCKCHSDRCCAENT